MSDISMADAAHVYTHTGALILAAGKGTRMFSDAPKVLQVLLEKPMLAYVYDALEPVLGKHIWTVVGHHADMVREAFPEHEENFVLQEQQLGTGHALQVAWSALCDSKVEHVLVINGDTPLVQAHTLRLFLRESLEKNADLAFMTLTLPDPGAFGRVVREKGTVTAVIEAKDYTADVFGAETGEVNAGIYCMKVSTVSDLLEKLRSDNKSGEIYITDLIGLAVKQGLNVVGYNGGSDLRLMGINSPIELVRAEEHLRQEIVERHLAAGVVIRSQHQVRIGPDVSIGKGADITGPCEIYGPSRIDGGVRIASHCRLDTCEVGTGTFVRSFSHLNNAQVGKSCIVGPYGRLRTGCVLEDEARIGNFVEMKKTTLGKGAKANHLSYLGDADIGSNTNIGAGTITCNLNDRREKHPTKIGKNAFIGSNSCLVAPVEIGDSSLVAAGSVITKDVPEGHMGLTRAPLRILKRK